MTGEQPAERLARIRRQFPLWRVRRVARGHGWTAHRRGCRDIFAATLGDLERMLAGAQHPRPA